MVEEQRQIQAKSYSYVERVSGLTDSRRTGESQIKPCKGNQRDRNTQREVLEI